VLRTPVSAAREQARARRIQVVKQSAEWCSFLVREVAQSVKQYAPQRKQAHSVARGAYQTFCSVSLSVV
jgi:hypothetical protein